jgi:hypothetical protein
MVLPVTLILTGADVAWAEAGGAEAKQVVVGQSIIFAPKAQKYRAKVWEKVEDAVKDSGWAPVKVETGPNGCVVKDCPREIAQRELVETVLSIDGNYASGGYSFTVKVWSKKGRNGQSGWVGEFGSECGLCSGAEFAEAVSTNVRKALAGEAERLLAAAKMEVAAATPEEKTAAPPLSLDPTAGPTPSANLVAPPAPTARESMSWVPWTIMGAGALAVGYGVWGLHEDGQSTGSCSAGPTAKTCDTYSSHTLGVVSIVGGGVLAMAGVIWVVTTPSHATSVSVSSNHVALSVRF